MHFLTGVKLEHDTERQVRYDNRSRSDGGATDQQTINMSRTMQTGRMMINRRS